MEELVYQGTYSEYRAELGGELQRTAEGFVRIGYLLKVARDTNVLQESGYKSVAEFAEAEFGLTKDVVSRYIAINDKYAENGYSQYLKERYEGYGIAKLQEMLTLPDVVVDVLTPDITKRELQDIKKEIKEEQAISDLEVMMEDKDEAKEDMTLLQKVIHQYFYENRDKFLKLEPAYTPSAPSDKSAIEMILDAIAPTGIEMLKVRISGIGRMMLSINGADFPLELINVRAEERTTIEWTSFIREILDMFPRCSKEMWEEVYGESFEVKSEEKVEEKVEVAPVQQENEAPANLHEVNEAIPIPEPVEEIEEAAVEEESKVEEETEENIPGQMIVEDYPEMLPEEQPIEDEKEESVTNIAEIEVVNKGLDEIDRRRIWNEIVRNKELIGFFVMNTAEDEVTGGKIMKERYERIYKIAVELAADFEKLMTDSEGGLQ